MADTTSIEALPSSNTNNISLDVIENTQSNIAPQQLSKETISQIVQGLQSAGANNMTKLPSRDIPTDTTTHTQDPQIKPNYVPPPQQDYIPSQKEEPLFQSTQPVKQDRLDMLYEEIQIPLLILILFFLFQLPVVHKAFIKYIPHMLNSDGNHTITGILVKSSVFASIYYGLSKLIYALSS